MREQGDSANELIRFAITLCKNMMVLLVSGFWLTTQFSTTVCWRNLGNTTYMVTAENRGWIFHRMNPPVTPGVGLRFTERNVFSDNRESWEVALADSNVQKIFPGLLTAQTPRFRLFAIRHWLLFAVAMTTWMLRQLFLRRQNASSDDA